jgi:hypothetical protein
MNSLFHGMDFSSMVQPRPFAWPEFFAALIVLSTWRCLPECSSPGCSTA